MNFPLISEYVEAIKSAEDNLNELTNLRPVLGKDGLPLMTGGNFAVVFKMQDVETEKYYALKCFTKEQEGRDEAYQLIMKELYKVDSHYLISLRYMDNELFVDTDQTTITEFPVLLMDWVEGKTLDVYLTEIIANPPALKKLACDFFLFAQWLISQPFAHGDLKPDNILVREDGTLVLVDYDGMYVPAMKGQKARELGSPNFRHPLRTENDFDEHIDDLPIVSILLSLCIAYVNVSSNQLINKMVDFDNLFFREKDYRTIHESVTMKKIPSRIKETTNYFVVLQKLCDSKLNNLKELQLSSIHNLINGVNIDSFCFANDSITSASTLSINEKLIKEAYLKSILRTKSVKPTIFPEDDNNITLLNDYINRTDIHTNKNDNKTIHTVLQFLCGLISLSLFILAVFTRVGKGIFEVVLPVILFLGVWAILVGIVVLPFYVLYRILKYLLNKAK